MPPGTTAKPDTEVVASDAPEQPVEDEADQPEPLDAVETVGPEDLHERRRRDLLECLRSFQVQMRSGELLALADAADRPIFGHNGSRFVGPGELFDCYLETWTVLPVPDYPRDGVLQLSPKDLLRFRTHPAPDPDELREMARHLMAYGRGTTPRIVLVKWTTARTIVLIDPLTGQYLMSGAGEPLIFRGDWFNYLGAAYCFSGRRRDRILFGVAPFGMPHLQRDGESESH